MAESFVIELTSRSVGQLLSISGVRGVVTDPNIQMQLKVAKNFALLPGEWITSLICPSGHFTAAAASGLLSAGPGNTSDDISNGVLTWGYNNLGTTDFNYTSGTILNTWTFPKSMENSPFNVHWLRTLNTTGVYASDLTEVYSYPHNLQASEVKLTMIPISGSTVRYYLSFPDVVNSGDSNYSSSNRPYQAGFQFMNITSVPGGGGCTASGKINGSDVSFQAGLAASTRTSGYALPFNTGFFIDLPLYDPRTFVSGTSELVPASYVLYLGYNGVNGAMASRLGIYSSHFDFLKDMLPSLDTKVANSLDPNKLTKSANAPILIDDETLITRNRFSIGIRDISVVSNSYVQQGVYVSPYFTNENGIYTFSLKVTESVPNYPNIDPYSTVRYFAEFNGQGWEPISPINRNSEILSDGTILPKMLVFDKDPGNTTTTLKYLNYITNATAFHIKIVFDTTMVTGNFTPPEIQDYKCVIFDKQQLLEL